MNADPQPCYISRSDPWFVQKIMKHEELFIVCTGHGILHVCRAVDPHSFFMYPDPDPAVFFNGDLDPAAISMGIRIQL